jgi:uncharacterized protein YbjT (DUF2867 family)
MPKPVLVLGAAGTFGSRFCRLLARERHRPVVLAGRDATRLTALQGELRQLCPAAGIVVRPLTLPRDLSSELLREVDAVVHAAGPFQGQDYAVARACIAAGVHYVDLADGRDFVAGFDALDADARAAGVLAVSGASSVPGISGAVVARLRTDFAHVDDVRIGIAPGSRAPLGRATIAATLSYAGRPIPGGVGWQDLHRRGIACDGVRPLAPRWFGRCDVPDLALLQRRDPAIGSVRFDAGLEPALGPFGLRLLSWAVRRGLLANAACLAGPIAALAHRLGRLGSDRGGMFVELGGRNAEGRPLRRGWSLIAEPGEGPWCRCCRR